LRILTLLAPKVQNSGQVGPSGEHPNMKRIALVLVLAAAAMVFAPPPR
jgi:hypothetical protein